MYTINENLKETTCPVHLLKEHFGKPCKSTAVSTKSAKCAGLLLFCCGQEKVLSSVSTVKAPNFP